MPVSRRSALCAAAAALALTVALPSAARADLSEDFDPRVPAGQPFTPAGWSQINLSNGRGATGWFQGNPPSAGPGGAFVAHQGDDSAYIAANYNSTTANGTISNWLITPQITTLSDGDTVSFFTRIVGIGDVWPDRLEVRLSTNGACDPGTTHTGVGDFTTLLTTVNPTLSRSNYPTGYPFTWTQISAELRGLPANPSGCVAFRYHVPNAGPNAINSDFIGIDTFRFVDDVTPPVAPTIASVSPASPSNDANPTARGTAEQYSTVKVYGDATCSGPVLGTGTAAAFAAGGVAFSVPGNATTTPYATATDGSLNVSPCSAAGPAYDHDGIAPVTVDDVPATWGRTAPQVTLTATDAGSGVAATYYTVGADPAVPTTASAVYDPAAKPVLNDGERIRYFSVDAAGNAETRRLSEAAKVDATAPATADDVPSSWVRAAPEVTLSATDAGSGVAATYYTVGASPAVPTTASAVYDPAAKPVLNDGERIRYFSVDAAGNAEAPRLSDAAQVDGAPPVTTDDVPETRVASHVVRLTATDAGSGVAATYYTVGADPAPPTTASAVYDPAAPPVLTDGERIRYFSVDAAGNAEAPRSSLTLQAPLPEPVVVTVTQAPARLVRARGAQVVFLVDPLAASYECRLNGGAWEPCRSPYELNGMRAGDHRVEIRGVMADGRVGPATVQEFQINPYAPGITLPDRALRATRAGAVGFGLGCSPREGEGRGRCFGSVRLTHVVRTRGAKKVVTLGKARFDAGADERAAVKLKLTAAGRRLLAAAPGRRLQVRVVVDARDLAANRTRISFGRRLTGAR
jgi:hypothetical protein